MWMRQRVRISYGAGGSCSYPLEAPRGSGAVLMRFSADWQLTWLRRVGVALDNCKRIQLVAVSDMVESKIWILRVGVLAVCTRHPGKLSTLNDTYIVTVRQISLQQTGSKT